MSDTLESLRRIKQEITTKENLKADMWCHFGKVVIRGPDQGNAQINTQRKVNIACESCNPLSRPSGETFR